ncbi:hypothetical protein [Dongia sp.]|uniref:hypothetical protein n=1 Tax=Dongia sp. TaxID=1977262 RepID=UPI0035AE5CCC
MNEMAAFLISSSDEFVALWLADILLRLLLPRHAIGSFWTSLVENFLIAISAAGIERALPSASGSGVITILALKALGSVVLTIAGNHPASGRRQPSPLLAMIALRCFAAFLALRFLEAAGPSAGFFVFPFVVLTAIDIALWLACRFGWQGSALAVPLESSLIIAVLLGIVAASVGRGPARETIVILAFIIKIIVTRLSLGLQAQIKGAATDPQTRATWSSIVLRALGYAFGTWIVLT